MRTKQLFRTRSGLKRRKDERKDASGSSRTEREEPEDVKKEDNQISILFHEYQKISAVCLQKTEERKLG